MIERNQVAENLKWKTEDIFSCDKEIEDAFSFIEDKLDFSIYKGKLKDKETILSCLKSVDELSITLEKLGIYAYMKHDENTADSKANELLSKVEMLEIKFSSQVAFITPELNKLSKKFLLSLLKDKAFIDYDYSIKGIIKSKKHILSEEIESTLALGGQVFGGYKNVFGMIDNADLPLDKIKHNGKTFELSHGMYSVLLKSKDQKLRQKVFNSYYNSYKSLLNTIGETYIGSVNKDIFLSKVKKFDSCLDKALFGEDVNKKVYLTLLDCVNNNLNLLNRYVQIKKNSLGLKKITMADMYVPIVDGVDYNVTFDEAFDIVLKGLSPLGKDYQNLLLTAKNDRWIDVVETKSKRSGAYSIGGYGLKHPYVLLNYQQDISEIFTIAHELGHAMHTYFSNKTQPYPKADYTIFVAEVASTVNEVLLINYLLKSTNDKQLKKYLLAYYTDMIKGTLFRQTMFAEFEYKVHSLVENGKPLSVDVMNNIYYDLNCKYYGKEVSSKQIAWEWARIPHFYNAFYVYKYATGIISAITIADRILTIGEPAVKDYIKFLSSGGSDSPVELLKIAGVNLNSKAPYQKAMASFKKALDDFESL